MLSLNGGKGGDAVTADNILEFNIQVMRAIAALYKQHPTVTILGAEQLAATQISPTDQDFEKKMETVSGTLRWLFRNRIITGTFDEGTRFPAIFDAQLSASACHILSTNEPNAQNQTLGELAISAASQPGTKEESVAAELIARRLRS
jgi:hypothetical protein